MKAVFLDRQTFSEEIDFSAIEAIVTSLTCYPTTEATEIIKRCQDAEIIITNKVDVSYFFDKFIYLKIFCEVKK